MFDNLSSNFDPNFPMKAKQSIQRKRIIVVDWDKRKATETARINVTLLNLPNIVQVVYVALLMVY